MRASYFKYFIQDLFGLLNCSGHAAFCLKSRLNSVHESSRASWGKRWGASSGTSQLRRKPSTFTIEAVSCHVNLNFDPWSWRSVSKKPKILTMMAFELRSIYFASDDLARAFFMDFSAWGLNWLLWYFRKASRYPIGHVELLSYFSGFLSEVELRIGFRRALLGPASCFGVVPLLDDFIQGLLHCFRLSFSLSDFKDFFSEIELPWYFRRALPALLWITIRLVWAFSMRFATWGVELPIFP